MTLRDFQDVIHKTYQDKDSARGLDATFMYFVEEVGELATSLREETQQEQEGEFADVLAWLLTLANLKGIDLQKAFEEKYAKGCSKCRKTPCVCVGDKP